MDTFGFLDESAIQLNPKKRRVINTPLVRYRERESRFRLIFGFIALHRSDAVMFSDSCKSNDMIDLLKVIRKQNPDKPLCIVLDNDLKRELSSVLDFDEMIKSCEGVALDLFGERREGYSVVLDGRVYWCRN